MGTLELASFLPQAALSRIFDCYMRCTYTMVETSLCSCGRKILVIVSKESNSNGFYLHCRGRRLRKHFVVF